MPIRKELRPLYRTDEYKAARAACRDRSGDRCQNCGAPNGEIVLRAFDYWTPHTLDAGLFYMNATRNGKPVTVLPWHYRDDIRLAHFPRHDGMKIVGIQCGCAHLDNDPTNNAPENLRWLCRGCHLAHDRLHHKRTRSTRKDAARPLLRAMSELDAMLDRWSADPLYGKDLAEARMRSVVARCDAQGIDTPQLRDLKAYLSTLVKGAIK